MVVHRFGSYTHVNFSSDDVQDTAGENELPLATTAA
jgi:hypothetical protein